MTTSSQPNSHPSTPDFILQSAESRKRSKITFFLPQLGRQLGTGFMEGIFDAEDVNTIFERAFNIDLNNKLNQKLFHPQNAWRAFGLGFMHCSESILFQGAPTDAVDHGFYETPGGSAPKSAGNWDVGARFGWSSFQKNPQTLLLMTENFAKFMKALGASEISTSNITDPAYLNIAQKITSESKVSVPDILSLKLLTDPLFTHYVVPGAPLVEMCSLSAADGQVYTVNANYVLGRLNVPFELVALHSALQRDFGETFRIFHQEAIGEYFKDQSSELQTHLLDSWGAQKNGKYVKEELIEILGAQWEAYQIKHTLHSKIPQPGTVRSPRI